MSRLGWFLDVLFVCLHRDNQRHYREQYVQLYTAQEWRELMDGATVTYGPMSGKASA